MTTGTGLALLGVWGFCAVAWGSGKASGTGMWVAVLASVITVVIICNS